MRYHELEVDITEGESSTVEFKKSTSELSEAMESICGFLNNRGGTVYIGVKDNGEIVGQDVADTTKRDIARHLKEIEPAHNCDVLYIPIPDTKKHVIVIKTDHQLHERPFAYKGRPFYREESTTSLMPQRMYQKLLTEKHQLTEWDARPAKDHAIDDLSRDKIINVMKRIMINRKLDIANLVNDENVLFMDGLSRLHLLHKNKPTHGSMILFGKSISPINYGQSLLKLASFSDKSKNNFIDSKQEYGNIFDLLEQADAFIYRHTNVASHFEGNNLQRVDTPDYPYLALREILINAFCHRDYSHNTGYVAIEIYPESLDIISYGAPLSEIKSDVLENPPLSIQRNKLIADVLYRAGFIESFGTGILRIVQLCQEAGMLPPQFTVKNHFFTVSLYKKSIVLRDLTSDNKALLTTLSIRQQSILSILKEKGPLSNKYLLENLGVNITDRTLRTDLNVLLKHQLVAKIGNARATIWALFSNPEESGRIRKNPEESS